MSQRNEETLKQMTSEWKGRKILVSNKSLHPHAGETATAIGFEKTGAGHALRVRGDDGVEFYIFTGKDIVILSERED